MRVRPNKSERMIFLVHFDGTQSAVTLLDSFKRISSRTRSVQHFVYIDPSSIFKLSDEARMKRNDTIVQLCQQFGYEIEVIPLSNVINIPDCDLEELFENIKSPTSKEDLLGYFIKAALIQVANEKGANKIIVNGTATKMAGKLISSFSKGRGLQLPEETGTVEFLDEFGVAIGNPLRDFVLEREIVYYWYRRELKYIDSLSFEATPDDYKNSLNGLSQFFITDLHSKYSQTIHTLLRSVDKLHSHIEESTSLTRCSLCLGKLNKDEYSHSRAKSIVPREELCYSCQSLSAEVPNNEYLENFIRENFNRINKLT